MKQRAVFLRQQSFLFFLSFSVNLCIPYMEYISMIVKVCGCRKAEWLALMGSGGLQSPSYVAVGKSVMECLSYKFQSTVAM